MKITLIPKDKKLLKDPAVKKWFKHATKVMNERLKDYEKNMMIYGCHIVKMEEPKK